MKAFIPAAVAAMLLGACSTTRAAQEREMNLQIEPYTLVGPDGGRAEGEIATLMVPERDERRDAWLTGQGIRTVRLVARDVLRETEAAVLLIIATCEERTP